MSAPLIVASLAVIVDVSGEGEISRPDVASRVASALEYRVVPPAVDRAISERHELDRSMAVCGLDAQCLADRLARAGAGLGLFVDVNLTLSPALISALLVDVAKRDAAARAIEMAEKPTALELSRAVDRAVKQLIDRAAFPLAGRVQFEIEPGVELVLEGGEKLPLPTAILLPGDYRARAGEQEVLFRVEAGKDLRVLVEPESPPLYRSPWLWTGVAVGVAAIVTAVVIATLPDSEMCICLDGSPACETGMVPSCDQMR